MKAAEFGMRIGGTLLVALAAFLCAPRQALAHCDTLDGPVVKDAKAALQKGDVTPALKWVQKGDEAEIRSAFQRTLTVRNQGAEAAELADRWFFETLVRIHRQGEGAPYTGLKPAGAVEPGIAAADRALEKGTVDDLVKAMNARVGDGIRDRFSRAAALKRSANESVEAGREYVEAYVEFIHFVERLQEDATTPAGHHPAAEPPAGEGHPH